MNIYQPYEELADTPEMLHLKLNDVRERMVFIYYRAVPIGLFLMIWFVLQQLSQEVSMGINYLFIVVLVGAALSLLARPYITEIKIAEGNVFLVQKTIIGVKEINIPINEVDYIRLDANTGRGGVKFILCTRKKKAYLILNIPRSWTDEKHTMLITETLKYLLGVEIKEQ